MKLKKILFNNFPLVLILLLLNIWTWKHIPSLQFQGEGAFYFLEFKCDLGPFFPVPAVESERLARIIFHFLPQWFGDRMFLYMSFLFAVMLLMDLIIYLLTQVISKSKLVAFLTTLFCSLNYMGSFNMFSQGGYQWFVQRAILLPFVLLAFSLLVLHFRRGFWSYYIFSLLLYLFTIRMGFYGTMFLPLFIFYPLFYVISHIRERRRFLKTFWTFLPFLVGNLFIIRNDPNACTGPACVGNNFLTAFFAFVSKIPDTLSGMTQQLSVMTLPLYWEKGLWKFLDIELGWQLSKNAQILLAQIIVTLLYFAAFLVIRKLRPDWKVLAWTSLLALVSMLIFNDYITWIPSRSFESLRFFYFPSTMLSLFWGLFFAAILFQRKLLLKIVCLILLLLWTGYNINTIQRAVKEDAWRHKANKEILETIKQKSPILKEKPYLLFFPGSLNTFGGYGLHFAQRFYGHPDSRFDFHAPNLAKLAKEGVSPETIYVFRFDHQTRTIIDETESSRLLLKQLELELNFK